MRLLMNRLVIVLIGTLSIQSGMCGMWTQKKEEALSNDLQREEAINQFKTGKDQKNKEAMLPVLLEDQQNGKVWDKKFCWLGVSTFVGGFACLCGILKYMPDAGLYHVPTGIAVATTTVGAAVAGGCCISLLDRNITIKMLEKKDKTKLDWYGIRELVRKRLRTSTDWTCTSKRAEDMFTEDDPCEVYNRGTNAKFAWNMKDPNFVKEVLSGKYNSSSWTLRKTEE
jgi:hypothetical protein